MLNVVQFGEFAAIVGCGVLLELTQRLASQVAPVHQEEDTACARELDKAIDEADCGVSLAGAGSHLDKGAWPVVGQGVFEVGDSFYLSVPQPRGDEFRHLAKT